MAKKSWMERNKRKAATVKKYAALRAELKAKKDYAGLSKLPKDASPVRLVNRCEMSGRRRGYLRKFAASRLTFREAALNGLIPGVEKRVVGPTLADLADPKPIFQIVDQRGDQDRAPPVDRQRAQMAPDVVQKRPRQ